MPHIHIGHHYFGSGNVGDDWMLAGFLSSVDSAGIDVRLTCCIPHDREAMRLRFPRIEWLEYERGIRAHLISQADAWLGLGDTPFQSDTGNWLLDHLEEEMDMCERCDTRVFFLGVGAESRDAVHSPRATRIIRRACRIWSRDELSDEWIRAVAGDPKRVAPGADVANLYFEGLGARGRHRGAAVGLVINLERPEQLDIPELARFLSGPEPRGIRWIAQEVRNLSISEVCLWERFDTTIRERIDLAVPDYHGGSIDSFLLPYDGLSTLLSTRYHSALAGAWMGIAVSAYARSKKLRGLMNQLGLSECASLTSAEAIAAGIAAATVVSPDALKVVSATTLAACLEFFSLLESPRTKQAGGPATG